jgi:hypothetical protein
VIKALVAYLEPQKKTQKSDDRKNKAKRLERALARMQKARDEGRT